MDAQKRLDPIDTHPPGHRKRRKGATRLSCAECRRLKLRCDRSIPCGSCVKRGCGAICPDGSLTTGQGNRFVLASTQELHEKIAELATRVRELEDALRASHAHLSPDTHPLLTEELLRIKAPLQREAPAFRAPANGAKEEDPNTDVVDAFGSLRIARSGGTKYFGKIANSWYFLQNEEEEDGDAIDDLSNLQQVLPPEILARSCAFPIGPAPRQSLAVDVNRIRALFWYLPATDVAEHLRTTYYHYAAWMYNPISAESFHAEVFSQFYSSSTPPDIDEPGLSHRLSLMFMVLAIGSLVDTAQSAYNIEAEKYHQLARAALFESSIFDEPTITAVQALFLMTFYLFLADRHGTGSGARWAIMGIAVKIAQSIGLHRDSGRWKVEHTETQRRRELFWELYTYDSWQCLTFGRPPSFALAHVDCKMPHTNDTTDEQSFHAWKHRFTSECMSLLHDQAFSAKTPTYATVLQLDRRMRAFPVPPILQVEGFGSSEPRPGGYPETVSLTLQRHIVLALREMNLLYLHRSFFARAVSDHPKDPLGSPYGTSVLAAYRSAGSLVALMRNLHKQLKAPSERIWFLWTHMFSCAIVLGSIVTRCPSLTFAPSALLQLDSACELFSTAARGFRAGKVLTVMLSLQEKAHVSLNDFRRGRGSPGTRGGASASASPVDENDELATLGGRTRLVAKREAPSPTLAFADRSPTSHNPVVPLPLPAAREEVHPNVLAYLRTFGARGGGGGVAPEEPVQVSPASASSTASGAAAFEDVGMYGMASVAPLYAEPTGYGEPAGYAEAAYTAVPVAADASGSGGGFAQSNGFGGGYAGSNGYAAGGGYANGFPTYFPVFDYGGAGEQGYMEPNTPGGRRSSGTPEATMQSTWQDFVDGLAM